MRRQSTRIAVLALAAALVTSGAASPSTTTDGALADLLFAGEEVEPGVTRIAGDAAGHDLDETHPDFRYDMDAIAIAPDGTVWLRVTYSRSDNDANDWGGPMVWALGRPGIYPLADGEAPPGAGTFLYMQEGGPDTLVEVTSTDATLSVPDFTETGRGFDSPVVVRAGKGWVLCLNLGRGVRCTDQAGEETTYLASTEINQIAARLDGSLWAVGGYAGDNGGLYRIELE